RADHFGSRLCARFIPAQRRDCAPEYVRRRKTPLTYLFSGRPARLSDPKLSVTRVLHPPGSIQPYKAGLGIAAQLVGQGALRAGLEAMFQSRQADDTNRAFIADAYEFAARTSLHGNGREYRNDGRKLAALEDHVWAHARSAAGRKRVFPEAMAFLE